MKAIACGYEVEAQPKRYDRPATIHIHKLGSPDHSWMTPDETRAYAAMLLRAADEAEVGRG